MARATQPLAPRRASKTGAARERELSMALALMHFGFRKMIEEPDRMLARRGFGRVHHRVLFFVARQPGLSVGELLAILEVSKQSVHRPMQDLLRADLLTAEPQPDDRRVKRLRLTAAGREFEERLSGVQRRLFERVFADQGAARERHWREVMHELGEGKAERALPSSPSTPSEVASR